MSKKLILTLGLISSACSHRSMVEYSHLLPSSVPAKKSLNEKTVSTIDYIDKNRFRIHQSYTRVWDCMLDLMLKNYNLTIANKSSGLMTTEWDSFYLDNKVYRNKLSVRVKQLNWNMVDVIVYNNVEVLADNRESMGPMVWLPENDGKYEIGRIITNLSILLRMGKPNLPKEYIAGKTQKATNTQAR